MASYIKVNKPDKELSRECCNSQQSTSTWCSSLPGRSLLAVLVVILIVTLLFDRLVHLSLLQAFNSPHMSTVLAGCTGATPNICLADKLRTIAAYYGLLNSNSEGSANVSAPCPADAVAHLANNVYSDNELLTRRLPQCIIIGVAKAGTVALMKYLNLHPDLRVADHEIGFFHHDNRYRRGLEWYRRQMPASHTGWLFEVVSTSEGFYFLKKC